MKQIQETSKEAFRKLIASGTIPREQQKVLKIFLATEMPLSAADVYQLYKKRYKTDNPDLLQNMRRIVSRLFKLGDLVHWAENENEATKMRNMNFVLADQPAPRRKFTKRQIIEAKINKRELELVDLRAELHALISKERREFEAAGAENQMGFSL